MEKEGKVIILAYVKREEKQEHMQQWVEEKKEQSMGATTTTLLKEEHMGFFSFQQCFVWVYVCQKCSRWFGRCGHTWDIKSGDGKKNNGILVHLI